MSIMEMKQFLDSIEDRIVQMDECDFKSFICVMVERWSKVNDQDCRQAIDDIAISIHVINDIFGEC